MQQRSFFSECFVTPCKWIASCPYLEYVFLQSNDRWGYPFLYESYLYHLHRLDHRHNFSPYFYTTYLSYSDGPLSSFGSFVPALLETIFRSSLIGFGPQMLLAIGGGLICCRAPSDLAFAWFVQTSIFVTFNKVCTSQVRSPPHKILTFTYLMALV